MSKKQATLHYEVTVEDAVAHLFRVTLTFEALIEGQILSLPNWIPGSYMIRDFSRHIVSFESFDEHGSPIKHSKIEKSSWKLDNQPGDIKVSYLVYAWDLSVRGAHLDQTHGFFNGTSLFLEPEGLSELPCKLTIVKPDGDFAKSWRLASSLTESKVSEDGFGDYVCENYDELIDHPVEMGRLTMVDFDVAGTPHQLVIQGYPEQQIRFIDLDRIKNDLSRICHKQVEFFGELPSCVKKYVFLVTVLPQGYGGLEHRSSTALHCSQADLITIKQKEHTDDYLNFLTLCSHEYFHTWNVKQIKPKAFLPYRLKSESYTRQLWIFEGFTSYYEDRLAYLAGVINDSEYLKLVSQVITRVERGKGQELQSVAESSFDAWTRFYMQDQNAPNAIVSYYSKGKLIALCLDLAIREQWSNKKSLDDVLKLMWELYGKRGVGLEEGELETILRKEFSIDIEQTVNDWVYDTARLPLAEFLEKAGIELSWHSVSSYKKLTTNDDEAEVNLGATVKAHVTGAEIVSVYHGSNAHLAGLSTGDCVIAVNHRKVDANNIESVIAGYSVGDEVIFHTFRREELMTMSVTLTAADKNTCMLSKVVESKKYTINWLIEEF